MFALQKVVMVTTGKIVMGKGQHRHREDIFKHIKTHKAVTNQSMLDATVDPTSTKRGLLSDNAPSNNMPSDDMSS